MTDASAVASPTDSDEAPVRDGAEPAESSGSVAGEFTPSGPVEPGTPRLEHALFVVAGAYVAVLALSRLFVDAQGSDGGTVLLITAATLAVTLVCLGYFGLLTPDT